jgi:cystathionine beta-lyase family protein involved in aluminum resistance
MSDGDQVIHTEPNGDKLVVSQGTLIWDTPGGRTPVGGLSPGQGAAVLAAGYAIIGVYGLGKEGCDNFGTMSLALAGYLITANMTSAVNMMDIMGDCIVRGLEEGSVG